MSERSDGAEVSELDMGRLRFKRGKARQNRRGRRLARSRGLRQAWASSVPMIPDARRSRTVGGMAARRAAGWIFPMRVRPVQCCAPCGPFRFVRDRASAAGTVLSASFTARLPGRCLAR
ncbi:hypothetical protein GCM10027093_21520 [Paraburkholderia jirisanensis]